MVRMVSPRFTAQVSGPETALEMEGRRHVLGTGAVLHDFVWHDSEPEGKLLLRILAEAEEAWLYVTALYGQLAILAGD